MKKKEPANTRIKLEYRDVKSLRPNKWNPNEMRDTVFQFLVRRIKEVGFRDPILVMGDGTIIDGEHRWKAASAAGLHEVPCVVVDDDMLKAMIETVNHNLIRAEFNSAKYGRLISSLVGRYGEENLSKEVIVPKEEIIDITKMFPDGEDKVDIPGGEPSPKLVKKVWRYNLKFLDETNFEEFKTAIDTIKVKNNLDADEDAAAHLAEFYIMRYKE